MFAAMLLQFIKVLSNQHKVRLLYSNHKNYIKLAKNTIVYYIIYMLQKIIMQYELNNHTNETSFATLYRTFKSFFSYIFNLQTISLTNAR